MDSIQELWQRIVSTYKDFTSTYIERRIKDVNEWDGSPSRWDSTEAYCADCLIDVNDAAGREEKAQSHCKLPIREPGDNRNTFVRQAIYAASGGRGITRLQKPSDVPQDEWDMAVSQAADTLIKAYEEMEETAPDGVFMAAGKEPERTMHEDKEEQRAMSIDDFVSQIFDNIEMSMGVEDFRLMDIFHNDNGMYAVVNYGGKLWRFWIDIKNNQVVLSEPEQVTMEFEPQQDRSLIVKRQDDGRYRWIAIACTAILNRVGEIDTTQLFDSFVYYFNEGIGAEADIYHIPGSDVGTVDFVGRDGYTLIVSGLFDDDEIGRAVARGIERQPDMWGTSIMYQPLSGDTLDISGVDIPIFTEGILRKVTILQEKDAAALFTAIVNDSKEEVRMHEIMKKKIANLLGSAELVEELEERVDDVNQRVADENLIARQAEGEPEDVASRDVENEVEPELDEPVMNEANVVADLRERVANLESTVESLVNALEKIATAHSERLGRLERSETERKAAWLADLPKRSGAVNHTLQNPALYRPRNATIDVDGNMPASERASAILSNKTLKGKGRI